MGVLARFLVRALVLVRLRAVVRALLPFRCLWTGAVVAIPVAALALSLTPWRQTIPWVVAHDVETLRAQPGTVALLLGLHTVLFQLGTLVAFAAYMLESEDPPEMLAGHPEATSYPPHVSDMIRRVGSAPYNFAVAFWTLSAGLLCATSCGTLILCGIGQWLLTLVPTSRAQTALGWLYWGVHLIFGTVCFAGHFVLVLVVVYALRQPAARDEGLLDVLRRVVPTVHLKLKLSVAAAGVMLAAFFIVFYIAPGWPSLSFECGYGLAIGTNNLQLVQMLLLFSGERMALRIRIPRQKFTVAEPLSPGNGHGAGFDIVN